MSAIASLPEFTPEGAEKHTERIAARLEAVASNTAALFPLLREALARNAWGVLGYASPGAYARDRWGDTMKDLTPEVRREISRELNAGGMSTRAIAPVLGVSKDTVQRDVSGVSGDTPDAAERPPVVGLDGKTYNPVVSIKTTTETTTETFDAATGEAIVSPSPVVPHEGVTAWLESDQSLQDRKYITAFVKAMPIQWMEFDPERIGRLAPADVLHQLELSVESINRFAETVKRSRPGLRAV